MSKRSFGWAFDETYCLDPEFHGIRTVTSGFGSPAEAVAKKVRINFQALIVNERVFCVSGSCGSESSRWYATCEELQEAPRSDIFRQHFVFMTYDILLYNDDDIKEGNANYIIPQNKPDNPSSRPQYIKLGMGIRYSLPAYTEDVQMSKHVFHHVTHYTFFNHFRHEAHGEWRYRATTMRQSASQSTKVLWSVVN